MKDNRCDAVNGDLSVFVVVQAYKAHSKGFTSRFSAFVHYIKIFGRDCKGDQFGSNRDSCE